MFRFTPIRIIFIGVLLVLCGLVLGSDTHPTLAQTAEPEPAEYVGSKTCSGCHRALSRSHALTPHGQALQVNSKDKPAFKADFTKGQQERTVSFPGEAAPRPFTQDDVAYVIGVGQHVERYVWKKDKSTYLIFPAQWNTEKKVWEPYIRENKTWPDSAAYDFARNCAGCHTTGLDIENTKWKDIGVSCEACHGPGSKHADAAGNASDKPTADELTAIRGSIVLSADAQICGQCHSQGTEPSQKLTFPITYKPGDDLLASGSFALVLPTDPDHWWPSGHAKAPNMQYNEWVLSNHSKSLENMKKDPTATADCLQCHSAEPIFNARVEAARVVSNKDASTAPISGALTVQDAKFSVTCVACHSSHTESKYQFNLPQDPYTLCTSCHKSTSNQTMPHHPVQDMFEGKQVVSQVTPVVSTHFTDPKGPKCQSCHMPTVPNIDGTRDSHTMKLVTFNPDSPTLQDTCTACHTDIAPDAMKKFVTASQQRTKDRLTTINATLRKDSPVWIRTVVAFIETDGSYGIHNHRYTEALLSAVEAQIGLIAPDQPTGPVSRPVSDPNDCGQCHKAEYQQWLNSPHAKASINDVFRQQYALQKGPTFCMNCHASGYDAATNEYKFEGVICSTCHYTENGVKHPPGPIVIANQAQACGTCHSGAHAPVYDEWLISKHSAAKVDCVDCHTPHNNGLRQNNVNAMCTNCHKQPITDAVHMSAKMTCVDCHMKTQTARDGVTLAKTGHTMAVDPATCSTCHGNIHSLAANSAAGAGQPVVTAVPSATPTPTVPVEEVAQVNLATGLAGGVVGTLIVVVIGIGLLRWRKLI